MAVEDSTLKEFCQNWEQYQTHLKSALAGLTAEQLAQRAAPHLWSIGEIVQHMIAGRAYWFRVFLGEGPADVEQYRTWDDPGQPARTADELLHGLDVTWALVSGCLARWTPEDMQKTFPDEQRGVYYDQTRSWVVWHVLEHDLHHGGEVSLALGMHHLPAPDM